MYWFWGCATGHTSFLLGLVGKQPMTGSGMIRSHYPLLQAAIVSGYGFEKH